MVDYLFPYWPLVEELLLRLFSLAQTNWVSLASISNLMRISLRGYDRSKRGRISAG